MLRRRHDLTRFVALGVAAALALAGCALGERPSLEQTPTAVGSTTGDPAIDAVLARLDGVATATFAAQYSARVVFSGTTTELSATQAGTPQRRSVTIGDIRFVTDVGLTRTCTLSTRSCSDGIDAARVSNTGVTAEFVFGDLAKRLRRDAAAQVSAGVASTIPVTDESATCVDVPLSAGTSVYCVLDNGVVTRFIGGDVVIELESYAETVDETQFTVEPITTP